MVSLGRLWISIDRGGGNTEFPWVDTSVASNGSQIFKKNVGFPKEAEGKFKDFKRLSQGLHRPLKILDGFPKDSPRI